MWWPVTTIARAFYRLDNLHDARMEAECRVIELAESNDILLAENSRLRAELDLARSQRDEANARSTWNRMAP